MRAQFDVGDIVLLPYTTFSGEAKKALFLIIHHERYVSNHENPNFTGVKISTHEYEFSVALSARYVQALKYDSYVNVNQQHRFTEGQVIQKLGKLNRPSMRIILLQMKRYFDTIWQQVSYKCYDTRTPKVSSPRHIDSHYYDEYIKTGKLSREKKGRAT